MTYEERNKRSAELFRKRYPYVACGRYWRTVEEAAYAIADAHFEEPGHHERFDPEIVEERLAEETDLELAEEYFEWMDIVGMKKDFLTTQALESAFAKFRKAWHAGEIDMEWPEQVTPEW